ncbi:MAG: hypothetical protein J7M08_07280 [Planctomycetes bacterium]|nr:hypothetical protein [Planctomycetota bacterium]
MFDFYLRPEAIDDALEAYREALDQRPSDELLRTRYQDLLALATARNKDAGAHFAPQAGQNRAGEQ